MPKKRSPNDPTYDEYFRVETVFGRQIKGWCKTNKLDFQETATAAFRFWWECGAPLNPIPEQERSKVAKNTSREIATLRKKFGGVSVSEQKVG